MSQLFNIFPGGESGAEFSPCRRYRYALWRRWADGRPLNVICLNPSTADETVNDPTITRLERRARTWGYPGLVVTNLFALRSTDPKALRTDPEPVGPENDLAIRSQAFSSGLILCAWGAHGALRGRSDEVRRMLAPYELYALRFGKDGSPSHPLYLAYSLRPVRWRCASERERE